MKTSHTLLATEKSTPADAELISHQLMLRAGLIRKLASGLYAWMPTGYRVLKKVEAIVREEMDKSGAVELFMPHIVPAELWEETGRWQKYGHLLLRIQDRHERHFCFGPTHEETFCDIARKELKSYKQLPLNLYQIQTKFRDEIRPRFGMMRAREFVMKDAYSFHTSKDCLKKTYQAMYDAYLRIFARLGLEARAVEADTGDIGGSGSHEFQVLAQAGEDLIFYSDKSQYAANIEKATALPPTTVRPAPRETLTLFATPGMRSIADLAQHHKIPATQSVKTLIGKNAQGAFFALIVRGDHELNLTKAGQLPEMHKSFTLATADEITPLMGAGPGSLGPVKCALPMIVDRDAAVLADFVCGANQPEMHYRGVNWDRDVPTYRVADIRNVVVGDLSPDGQGRLQMARGVEVGHIFQLGTQYSQAMNLTVLNDSGQNVVLEMGCYGLGVGRVVAAAIEQHHDDKGILWPTEMAPFSVALVPIGYHKAPTVRAAADKLYADLLQAGIEVLFDDRDERPGVMFADMDLIGIPHRIVISERSLAQNSVEYKHRQAAEPTSWPLAEVLGRIAQNSE